MTAKTNNGKSNGKDNRNGNGKSKARTWRSGVEKFGRLWRVETLGILRFAQDDS